MKRHPIKIVFFIIVQSTLKNRVLLASDATKRSNTTWQLRPDLSRNLKMSVGKKKRTKQATTFISKNSVVSSADELLNLCTKQTNEKPLSEINCHSYLHFMQWPTSSSLSDRRNHRKSLLSLQKLYDHCSSKPG